MIMVSPAATPRRRKAAVLAVVVTVAKGYCLFAISASFDELDRDLRLANPC
jgi:predicted benzoate:H+ symporter BenE